MRRFSRVAFACTLLAGTHAAAMEILRPQPIQYRAPFRYWGPYFMQDPYEPAPGPYEYQEPPPEGWGQPYGDRGTVNPGQMFDEQTWRYYHGPWQRPRPWGPRW